MALKGNTCGEGRRDIVDGYKVCVTEWPKSKDNYNLEMLSVNMGSTALRKKMYGKKVKFRYLSESVGLFKHVNGGIKSSKKNKRNARIMKQGATSASSDSISSFPVSESGSFCMERGFRRNLVTRGYSEDSDIVWSNGRNLGHLESNIGKKLWKIISELGVEPGETNMDFALKIDEMERADKPRKSVRQEENKLSQ